MLAYYADWVARLSAQYYRGYLSILAIIILALLGAGVFFVRRSYWISNTATSRIATAHQGYIEIEGMAKAAAGVFPLVSPLSGEACVWFEVSVDQSAQSDEAWINRNPRRIFHQKSDNLIVVDDGSGECVVNPDGATVYPERVRHWRGDTEMPSHASVIRSNPHFGRYQYTEKLILDQDAIYALGWFRTIRHDPHVAAQDAVKALLQDWKQDPRKMKSFDRDGNGVIDEEEWRTARKSARDLVYQQQIDAMGEVQSQIHMMADQPGSQRPFIISALDQVSLAKRYRRSGYALWAISIVFFYLWVTAFYLRG
ncbi:MAG: hypothetical protein PF483_13430 [Halothiobacillus sp.]|jgi:hypothetical protein|nr:hypothetical protein [Halothiobacillus sp.]